MKFFKDFSDFNKTDISTKISIVMDNYFEIKQKVETFSLDESDKLKNIEEVLHFCLQNVTFVMDTLAPSKTLKEMDAKLLLAYIAICGLHKQIRMLGKLSQPSHYEAGKEKYLGEIFASTDHKDNEQQRSSSCPPSFEEESSIINPDLRFER